MLLLTGEAIPANGKQREARVSGQTLAQYHHPISHTSKLIRLSPVPHTERVTQRFHSVEPTAFLRPVLAFFPPIGIGPQKRR